MARWAGDWDYAQIDAPGRATTPRNRGCTTQLVTTAALGRVHRDLRRREPEDQPAVTDVDVWEIEDIAKERAIRVRILRIEDNVCTVYHG